MSSREMLCMSSDEVAAFLDANYRAHVGTINPDGTPHVVPLSYVVLDGELTFWTDPRSRKVANIRRDPRVTCLVEDGSHFAELRAVQVCGRAELGVDRDTSVGVGLALFQRAAGAVDDEVRATVASLAAERVAVIVHPERIVSWDHRKLPGVRAGEIGS
ncbi:MAG TPA: TIGR03618 family F420-dependent PPOX class oxidoreductase [Acidimicrobiales bacterium]|jgi:PPOX class probable F420-dependent enzyme